LGVADHLGWAVVVAAASKHEVVDRRRIELIEAEMPPAPVEHEVQTLGAVAAAELVANVRASVARAAAVALGDLATALPAPVVSVSLRAWPPDFPDDIEAQRRAPYNARADGVMYRQELSELAHQRGWGVHLYDAKAVVAQATTMLGDRAHDVLERPRTTLGPPWTVDHRVALAATIVARFTAR
jgi:hypothetical protein